MGPLQSVISPETTLDPMAHNSAAWMAVVSLWSTGLPPTAVVAATTSTGGRWSPRGHRARRVCRHGRHRGHKLRHNLPADGFGDDAMTRELDLGDGGAGEGHEPRDLTLLSGPPTQENKGGPPTGEKKGKSSRPRPPAALAASELAADKMARQLGRLHPGRRCMRRRAGVEATRNCCPGHVRARRGEDAPGPVPPSTRRSRAFSCSPLLRVYAAVQEERITGTRAERLRG